MEKIRKIVIVGGGSSGWMSAALISRFLMKNLDVTLVESDQISTIGVGEATIPPLQKFNAMLGLNEIDFLKATKGTIKMGIEFSNWGNINDKYIHGFGNTGRPVGFQEFPNIWTNLYNKGLIKSSNLTDYSFSNQLAEAGKVAGSGVKMGQHLPHADYAFHFDASLYAKMLRGYAVDNGVKRKEGKIIKTNLDGESGYINSVELEDGTILEGDLFIDCSGFRGLLIEQALETGYEDWSKWLPCDRAIAVSSENIAAPRPMTQAIAQSAGWHWRIPLQHRTGNGHVYCSNFMGEDEATDICLNNLEGKASQDPMLIRFQPGHRKKIWNKNCVAIGLAGGFIEPLESTGIHLIQIGIASLLQNFPVSKETMGACRDHYNNRMDTQYKYIRDFIVAHYNVTNRDDSPFWEYVKTMEIPETLKDRLTLFKKTGHLYRVDDELFAKESWFQVLIGQNLIPENSSMMADGLSTNRTMDYIQKIQQSIKAEVANSPTHASFLAQFVDPDSRVGW